MTVFISKLTDSQDRRRSSQILLLYMFVFQLDITHSQIGDYFPSLQGNHIH